MNIDFYAIHNWLFPRVENRDDSCSGLHKLLHSKPSEEIPIINPKNPRAGLYVDIYTCFTDGRLDTGVYVRNRFDSFDSPVGIKLCLKLTFGRKNKNNYAKPGDAGSVAIELPIEEMAAFYSFIYVGTTAYNYSGKNKVLTVYKMGSRFKFSLSDREECSIYCSSWDIFNIAKQILTLVRIENPELTPDILDRMLRIPLANNLPLEISDNEQDIPSGITPNQKSAIWAIANQKWPSRCLETARVMQQKLTSEEAKRLIDAANSGRFEGWDNYKRLHIHGD